MYKHLIRPLLFLLEPEIAHRFAANSMKLAGRIPGFSRLTEKIFNVDTPDSAFEIYGLKFKNRIGMAAGFDKNAEFYGEFAALGFSFIEIGTVTPLPQQGNPQPRLFRIKEDQAMINRMGFNNKGVEYAVNKLKNRVPGLIIGGNIGKNTLTPNDLAVHDYAICFKKLYDHVDYFTINISCPNIEGMDGLQDPASISTIVHEIMKIRSGMTKKKPVFLKISPDLTLKQVDDMLDLYNKTGLDGIVAANTTTKRENLTIDSKRIEKIGRGGLSGNPLKERVRNMIIYICKQSGGSIPVIAVGGVMSPDDAAGLIKAGAVLVQVYTGFIYEGPFMIKRVNRQIENMFRRKNIQHTQNN